MPYQPAAMQAGKATALQTTSIQVTEITWPVLPDYLGFPRITIWFRAAFFDPTD